MALRDFNAADKAAFVELVERAVEEGVFSRRELNTAVTHCLVFAGCQANGGWRKIIGEKNPAEIAFFSSQTMPRLNSNSLLALCMSVALSAKGFSIDAARQQVFMHTRPVNGQFVGQYLEFKNKLGQCGVAKLERESESLFLLAAMQPRNSVLYDNAFKAQQPELTLEHIDNIVLPLFESAKVSLEMMYPNLASLLPYMIVNYQSCGLADWATRFSKDTSVASFQSHTQRWSKAEFCTEIAALQNKKKDLAQWLSPSVSSQLSINAGPSAEETSTMSKPDLRRWYERVRQDVEILCEHQPPAASRLQVAQARVKVEQESRLAILPKVSAIEKADKPEVKAAAVPIPNLDWSNSALPLEEQVKRTLEYIEKEARTTQFLSGFMVK